MGRVVTNEPYGPTEKLWEATTVMQAAFTEEDIERLRDARKATRVAMANLEQVGKIPRTASCCRRKWKKRQAAFSRHACSRSSNRHGLAAKAGPDDDAYDGTVTVEDGARRRRAPGQVRHPLSGRVCDPPTINAREQFLKRAGADREGYFLSDGTKIDVKEIPEKAQPSPLFHLFPGKPFAEIAVDYREGKSGANGDSAELVGQQFISSTMPKLLRGADESGAGGVQPHSRVALAQRFRSEYQKVPGSFWNFLAPQFYDAPPRRRVRVREPLEERVWAVEAPVLLRQPLERVGEGRGDTDVRRRKSSAMRSRHRENAACAMPNGYCTRLSTRKNKKRP
jgi:hypothetical protein